MTLYWALFAALVGAAVLLGGVRFSRGAAAFLFMGLSLALVLVAGFQEAGVSRDYRTYAALYEYYASGGLMALQHRFYEPAFVAIASLGGILGFGVNFAYLVHAAVSLTAKGFLFLRASREPLLSLLLYFSYFYFLQDMTQIRVAAGVGLGYLGILALQNGRPRIFALFLALGFLFHFAVILLGIAYLVYRHRSLRLNVSFVIIGVLGLTFSEQLSLLFMGLIDYFGMWDPTGRLRFYATQLAAGQIEINPINRMAPHLVLLGALLVFWRRLRNLDTVWVGWVNVYSFGFLALGMLSFIPVLAYRVSDMFFLAGVLALPALVNVVKQRVVARLMISLVALVFFVYVMYGANLVGPYQFIVDW